MKTEEEKSYEYWATEILDTNSMPAGYFDISGCVSKNIEIFGFLGDPEAPNRIGKFVLYLKDINMSSGDFSLNIPKNSLGIVYGDRHDRLVIFLPDHNVYIGWVDPDTYKIVDNVHILPYVIVKGLI